MLSLMSGGGMVRRVGVVAEREYMSMEQAVRDNLNKATEAGALDPEKARNLLASARSAAETYLAKEKIREEYKTKGIKLLAEVESTAERVFKKNSVELKTVVELGVLTSGLESVQMRSDNKGSLVWVDQNEARIVAMNLVDRSKVEVGGEEEDNWVGVAANETDVWALLPKGVQQASWKKREMKQVIEADEFWQTPTKIEVFAGNVYVLDSTQSEIWKYPTLGETYGGRRRWLAAGITPDLTKVVDMRVVGDIWLLTSTGKLLRYSRGVPVAFALEGYPYQGEEKILVDPVAMYVTENTLYVLERGAERIVAVGQDGKFAAQYVNAEFAKADDLVVVDDKVYVLLGNVVKEFGL